MRPFDFVHAEDAESPIYTASPLASGWWRVTWRVQAPGKTRRQSTLYADAAVAAYLRRGLWRECTAEVLT